MIQGIAKQCVSEHIIYAKINNEQVKKMHYNNDGNKIKETIINVREVKQGRRSHSDIEDFFDDMIFNYGYTEI